MGTTESIEKLGERVVAAKAKLTANEEHGRGRFEYLKQHSPQTLDAILKSVANSFETCSAFLESTLLIAWMYNPQMCAEIVLKACKKVLKTPIDKQEFEWFKQYVFVSDIWFFQSPIDDSKFVYENLLEIANTMSSDIVQSMDGIYEHLTLHKQWAQVQAIANQTLIARQDHSAVGLLRENGIREIFETKIDNEQNDDMMTFVDSNLALNNLTSAASKINDGFQHHIKMVMSAFGEFQEAPMKKVERSLSKCENDYAKETFPKAAKLLDLVRCSVTFNTVDQLLDGYQALMRHMNSNKSIIELARVKNGFLISNDESSGGGYRDIKVNAVYKSQNPEHKGVNMVCEVQLLLINYLQEKKRIHKLYSLLREETFFKMVVKRDAAKQWKHMKVKQVLNVGQDVPLKYTGETYKCSVNSDLGLLAIEGEEWFGVVDIKKKKQIFSIKRQEDIFFSHHWVTLNGEPYLAVQVAPNRMHFFKVTKPDADSAVTDYQMLKLTNLDRVQTNGQITLCEFDSSFRHILLVVDKSVLEVRATNNFSVVMKSIKLQEQIEGGVGRDLRVSGDGTRCVLAGGNEKNYFHVIDIETEQQYKLESNYLNETFAPCFINGENKVVAVCGPKGRVEIWDVEQKQPIQELQIDSTEQVLSSTSSNNILAVGGADRKLRLFETRNWKCFYEKQFNCEGVSLHLTDDLQFLTFAGQGEERCAVLHINLTDTTAADTTDATEQTSPFWSSAWSSVSQLVDF